MAEPYYFVRISPANFLYALWLSLRRPVAAWRIALPPWLARRFERVRPYRIFTRDEWLLAHDAAFDAWSREAFPSLSSRHRVVARIGHRDVDFSRNVWQLLGAEFESLFLFSAMLAKSQRTDAPAASVVEPWIARAFTPEELDRMFSGIRIQHSAVNRFLEALYHWCISLAHLARELGYAARDLFSPPRMLIGGRLVWLGISPQEIADRDGRLDFAWAARFGHVSPRDAIFFPPTRATAAQRAHYTRNGIQLVEPQHTFGLLDRSERVRVAAAMLRGFLAAAFRAPAVGPLLARLIPRARYWEAAFNVLHAAVYVTSTSHSWPEKPEVAVARARGIRTIIWAYSANSPTFALESASFRDLGVPRSVIVAREFWVWNEAYAAWLAARQVEDGEARCEVRTVGPLMCGDARWLDLDSREARSRLGLPAAGTCVAIFDMPPMNDLWRDTFGGGPPMIDIDSYVAFWHTIERLLLRVPDCFALLKLKRDMRHAYRSAPELLQKLVDPSGEHARAGRIIVIDVNVDPYLPIAACDVALGVPYTSPVLAAHAIGRPAFYLDPLRRANWPSARQYRNITIQTEDEAAAVIAAAARGEPICARGVEAVTPSRVTVPL
jgi:hypothetical protein